MRFITETGSVYEVDEKRKLIRRLEGESNPTPRVGNDGMWKAFSSLMNVNVGFRALICWDKERNSSDPTMNSLTYIGGDPATLTSKVVKIIKVCAENGENFT